MSLLVLSVLCYRGFYIQMQRSKQAFLTK